MRYSLWPIALVYSITVSLWYIAMRTLGDSTWWMTILNQGAMLFTIPIVIFLGWAIVYPSRRLWLALLPALIILVMLLGPYARPYPASPRAAPDLRVVTYNVLYSNAAPESVATVLTSINPDLVLLQEVQPAMMNALVARLAAHYPYYRMSDEHLYGTTAAFSRWPVIEERNLELQADRQAVLLRVQAPDRTLTVIAAHLLAFNIVQRPIAEWPTTLEKRNTDQITQVRNLIQAANAYPDDPLILGCDCNSTEFADSARLLGTVFQSAAHTIGWAIPAGPQPYSRADIRPNHIDYIWYRGAMQTSAAYLWKESGGSDHAPLVAEFHWK